MSLRKSKNKTTAEEVKTSYAAAEAMDDTLSATLPRPKPCPISGEQPTVSHTKDSFGGEAWTVGCIHRNVSGLLICSSSTRARAVDSWNSWAEDTAATLEEPVLECPVCHAKPHIVDGEEPFLWCECDAEDAVAAHNYLLYSRTSSYAPAYQQKAQWNSRCHRLSDQLEEQKKRLGELKELTGITDIRKEKK